MLQLRERRLLAAANGSKSIKASDVRINQSEAGRQIGPPNSFSLLDDDGRSARLRSFLRVRTKIDRDRKTGQITTQTENFMCILRNVQILNIIKGEISSGEMMSKCCPMFFIF